MQCPSASKSDAGGYHDFGKFISYVANFPFIANITEMRIDAQTIAISDKDVDVADINFDDFVFDSLLVA